MKHWTLVALALSATLLPATAMAMSPKPAAPGKGGSSGGASSGGTSPTPVPEPASMLVLGSALGALGVARKFGRARK